ncbi:MAG: hypothetical protein Q9182_007400 [Xanthomendoza sp. 2 TL-2023]
MEDERRSSKRSRFDQTEPEAKRSSRFDRRSRSPSRKESETKRSRSPLASSKSLSPGAAETAGPKAFAADPAAAAAAARINASIQAKKGIQHVDVPPIRSTASPAAAAASPPAKTSGSSTSNINGDMYIADGDYIKDIEVNDLRNRYTLTKGSTQKMIKEDTGAEQMLISFKMSPPEESIILTRAWLPQPTSKDGLEQAVKKIEELMKQELPNLVDERRFRRREPEQVERDEFGRVWIRNAFQLSKRKWPEERIPIDLEPIPGFNLRAQVVGHGGAYVKHIQQETRCRVQIKGRNSGFMEHGTGRESDEPMYLHVAGPDPNEVQRARDLCEDLLANVKEQYERFKENPPQRNYGGGGYGQDNRQQQQGGYSTQNPYGTYGGAQSPATPSSATPGPPGAANSADYTAQYAQYYANQPGGDPYAAYGGYAAYVAMYAQYYQQQQQQQQHQATAPGAAPPAPPGEEPPPPPPPPPPSGSPPTHGGYNNVPPPPGM